MKRVAILGFGSMGRLHYDVWKTMKGVCVVAVCDKNPAGFKQPARAYGLVDVSSGDALSDSVTIFTDIAAMLATVRPDIVDVTLPTRFHADAAIAALEAGADVICEKPMALDTKGCDRMMAAAKRTGRKLMIAQCLRFAPEYRLLKDLVVSGKYGAVISANFTRLTAPPQTNDGRESWFFDETLSGGLALDLNIHDADVVRWLFGEPKGVTSRVHRRKTGSVDHLLVTYDYPNVVVTTEASWAAAPSFAFQFGYRVMFERATVVYDPWRKDPLFVYPVKGKPFAPKLKGGSAYAEEIHRFFKWVSAGRAALRRGRDGRDKTHLSQTVAPVENADIRASIALIAAERKAAATGRRVEFKG